MKTKINETQMVTILDELYAKVLNGVPKVSKPVESLANDYLIQNNSSEKAAKELTKYQVAKCGTSGFITGLGGLITLPVAIPANVSSVLYVQLRMIAAIAYMGGFDIQSDQVQTLAYACLTGSAIADVLKQTGIKVGEKIAVASINKIPGKVLTSINQKVGFRLITKLGTKGAVNLVKLVPVVGGIIGGAVDISSTQIIGKNAYNIFIKKEMPSHETVKNASFDISNDEF